MQALLYVGLFVVVAMAWVLLPWAVVLGSLALASALSRR